MSTGPGLLLAMLLVSWTSLLIQSAAYVHLRRQHATYPAEALAGRGYVRTAACRVLAAVVYVTVAVLQYAGVRIPGAGTLGPEALAVFTGVQLIWITNSALDVAARRRLRSRDVREGLVVAGGDGPGAPAGSDPPLPDPLPGA